MAQRTPRKPRPASPAAPAKSPDADSFADDGSRSPAAVPAAVPLLEDEFAEPGAADSAVAAAPSAAAKPARSPRSLRNPASDVTPAGRPQPVVSLDARKLSRKQQLLIETQWTGQQRGKALDSFMRAQVEAARAKFGRGEGGDVVLAANEANNLLIGLPMPALAMEYLFQQDAFLLGLVYHLSGLPSSCKSAFLYEIMRLFANCGGGAHLLETEDKWSEVLMRSIVRYRQDEVKVTINRCQSVEDWQAHMTYWLTNDPRKLIGTKELPGPGATVPILTAVDSIMGRTSQETQEKIIGPKGTGFATRGYSVEANYLSTYMRSTPHLLDGWPFAVFLVNHLKEGTDSQGRPTERTLGGTSVDFQGSFELKAKKLGEVKCEKWDGVVVRLRCYKNSFGSSNREIITRLLWWFEDDPETGARTQKSTWDWNWATVNLLREIKENPKYKGRMLKQLDDGGWHLATPKTSAIENLAWSRTLGMKEADAVPWQTLGEMIHQDHAVMEMLRRALDIHRRPILAGNYARQLSNLREALP